MKNRKSNVRNLVATDVSTLSRGFTERSLDPSYMDRPEAREAYGVYYGEVSYAKGEALGREILRRAFPELLRKDRLRMLDLGAGTGAFSQGVATALFSEFSGLLDLQLVDRSAGALSYALNAAKDPRITILVTQATLPEERPFLPGSFDIVTMANCLAENEHQAESFAGLLEEVAHALLPGGIMLLVEPADKRSSRELLSLGDLLISRQFPLALLAPCPGGRTSSCPALATSDDWCHEDRPANFSETLLKTAKSVGHIKDALKMSYLLFGQQGAPSPQALRLVSPLHKEKGFYSGDFCDGQSWWRIRLLNRNRSDLTRSFTRLHRGETIDATLLGALTSGSPRDRRGTRDWPKGFPVIRLAHPDGEPFDPEGGS
ncbi:MAG: methyltransferase domain-containing protein [Leptospirillia bacterium]